MTVSPLPTAFGPFDVALHWPFLRRNLLLARRRPWLRALDLLAEDQVCADGKPVPLGRARWRAAGFTAGEAGSAYHALVELERRRVVARYPGRGRRADVWTFQWDIGRWRSVPWATAGRDLDLAIRACACATFRAEAARNPGQSVGAPRQFWLEPADHLRPPGLLLVDSRGYGDSRAASARRPGQTLVDPRGYGVPSRPRTVNSEKYLRTSPDCEHGASEGEPTRILRMALPGRAWGDTERRLRSIADGLTVEQAQELARLLGAYRSSLAPAQRPGVPMSVAALEDLAASPTVQALRA